MLNSQPLGFYSPSALVQDAQRHGVSVLPVDLNQSEGIVRLNKCLRRTKILRLFISARLGLRLGLRMVRGIKASEVEQACCDRSRRGRFRDQADIVKRVRLEQSTLAILAESEPLIRFQAIVAQPIGSRLHAKNPQ